MTFTLLSTDTIIQIALVLNIHNFANSIVSPSLMTATLIFFLLPIASFKHSQCPFSKTATAPL